MILATRRASHPTRALSLVEVVVSLAVLSMATLGLAYATSTSVMATRTSKPRLIAQQAGQRVIEELRGASQPLATFYTTQWGAAVLTNTNTPNVHRSFDATSTFTEIIDPALQSRIMGRPSDGGAVLRVRFLSEADYNAAWGLSADLDFDGATNGALQHTGGGATGGPAYGLYPIVVEVHFRDEQGDQLYRVVTTIGSTNELDPSRS